MKNHKFMPEFVEGRGYSRDDWEEVSHNPVWTKEEIARAKPLKEVLPLLHAAIENEIAKRGVGERGAQKLPTKKLISLRLDSDIIEKFKSTGKGWQSRINESLKKANPV